MAAGVGGVCSLWIFSASCGWAEEASSFQLPASRRHSLPQRQKTAGGRESHAWPMTQGPSLNVSFRLLISFLWILIFGRRNESGAARASHGVAGAAMLCLVHLGPRSGLQCARAVPARRAAQGSAGQRRAAHDSSRVFALAAVHTGCGRCWRTPRIGIQSADTPRAPLSLCRIMYY